MSEQPARPRAARGNLRPVGAGPGRLSKSAPAPSHLRPPTRAWFSETLEAYELLRASSLNFGGNTEGRMILEGAADVVVADSANTQNDLIVLLDADPARVEVVYPAVDERFRQIDKQNDAAHYQIAMCKWRSQDLDNAMAAFARANSFRNEYER